MAVKGREELVRNLPPALVEEIEKEVRHRVTEAMRSMDITYTLQTHYDTLTTSVRAELSYRDKPILGIEHQLDRETIRRYTDE